MTDTPTSHTGKLKKGVKSTISEFWRGFRAPLASIGYMLKHPGTLKFVIPPVIIVGALLSVLLYFGLGHSSEVLGVMWEQPSGDKWYITWILGPLWYLVWFLTMLILAAAAFALSILLSIPLAGPFMEMLSEKVEFIETGFEAPFSLKVMLSNTLMSLSHALLLAIIAVVLGAISLSLSFIPILGQVLAIAFGVTVMPMLIGFNPFDYPMTIRLWPLGDKVSFIRSNLRLTYGFSLSTYIMMYIPFLNLLLLPACVVAATRLIIGLQAEGRISIRDRRKEALNATSA